MKWLAGEPSGMLNHTNGHVPSQQIMRQQPGQEHLVFMSGHMAAQVAPSPMAIQHQMQRNGQIAPSAKKLWGVEEQKNDTKEILNLNDQMWPRNPTWSTSDHTVSQPISMVARRPGSFPGGEAANILSPRSSETGGLGVKMVEYVLGSSPTSKDLEPRMRALVLNASDCDKEGKEKAPSPFEAGAGSKKDVDVNPTGQQNGIVQNGLGDDDKSFNRTPGSRQPSPAEEDPGKNGVVLGGSKAVSEVVDPHHIHQHLVGPHQHALQPQHPPLSLDPVSFEHVMALEAPGQFDQAAVGYAQQQQQQSAQAGMDSPGVLPHSFDVQQLFRSQQQATQLLQQQQYLATQQQQQLGLAAAPAAFTSAPYVINAQEPYLVAGPTVIPQYYGMAPWGMYPANIIQQGAAAAAAAAQQRRPLTPSSASDISTSTQNITQGQYQVIPAYYDQNGSIVMGNVRGIGNGTPMRLVSPAPVIVNAGTPASNMRILGGQTQQIGTPPAASIYNATPQQSLYSSSAASGSTISGLQTGSGVGGGFPSLATTLGYGNTSLGTIGSPALGSLASGLGLGNTTSGRRDSFDRNTSAFSPSLDYSRGKWPQSYGTLGTVTSSQSPLGIPSASLTPPPALTTNLQLGTLMTGAGTRGVLSAAPGAEAAKFRNGGVQLPTNGMFGSCSSIFSKISSGATRAANAGTGLDKPTGRSRLLEDFRNNRFPSLQLRDLANHIVEFSQDQHGSRFIQQKLERANATEKQMVFQEILSAAYNLMTDVFGNYVIQKFFEFGSHEQKSTLAQKVRGHVLPLALQMYGCRVIQKALESISPEQQQEIVRELDGHVLKCVKDQNGNHVVQKCIECVDPHALQFIINAFQGQVFCLSTHPYGCRVIQRILEHCTPEQTAPILEELHQHTEQLIQDQYGNYVIQHVLEHGKPEDKSQIIMCVRGKVLVLSQHKFASNVVEKCVTHASRTERSHLIDEVCNFNENALHVMMKDQYANYVVQKMIDVAENNQRKILMHKIRPHLVSLRKYTYGKHIIAKLEKFFMKAINTAGSGSELGPIGPPNNAGL